MHELSTFYRKMHFLEKCIFLEKEIFFGQFFFVLIEDVNT